MSSDNAPSNPNPLVSPAAPPAAPSQAEKKTTVSKLIAYATGALALAVVAAAAGSAVTYALAHRSETLAHLGDNVIAGIGMAIGGCLGSALVMRFKSAREYLASTIQQVNHHTNILAAARAAEAKAAEANAEAAAAEAAAAGTETDPS